MILPKISRPAKQAVNSKAEETANLSDATFPGSLELGAQAGEDFSSAARGLGVTPAFGERAVAIINAIEIDTRQRPRQQVRRELHEVIHVAALRGTRAGEHEIGIRLAADGEHFHFSRNGCRTVGGHQGQAAEKVFALI